MDCSSWAIGNLIAHNVTGIYFYDVKGGHIVIDNTVRSNLWPVTIGDGDPPADIWSGKNWDTYEGFDLYGDGFGGRPRELHAHAELDGNASRDLLSQRAVDAGR